MFQSLCRATAGVVAAAALCEASAASAREPVLHVLDLDGRQVAPFEVSGQKPVVFIFAAPDCPISNRYVPELDRLHREFRDSAAFWIVYPDRRFPLDALRRHAQEFGSSVPALYDAERLLVRLAAVTLTPEVAVFDRSRRLVYRGRIDNRVVDFGTIRAEPTVRDLQDALVALRTNVALSLRTTQAIGCYISE